MIATEGEAPRRAARPQIAPFLILLLLANLASASELAWHQLASIPDAEGFAAPFAGVSGGALIVAGGANFPGEKWREPATKKWSDAVFILPKPDAKWRRTSKLARPLGYGVAITTEEGLLCFGGSDATRHYAESFRLEWKNGVIKTTALPPLPQSCANACGALIGRTIYLAGGLEAPTATTALHTFWALDLDAPQPIWRELEPWPGPPRMLAVAGTFKDAFYLFSGASLTIDADGKVIREYLRDAYRFTPDQGWKRLADLPRAAAGAPSPAPFVGRKLLVLTGDDGANAAFQPLEKHPGFPSSTLAYDPQTDAWTTLGDVPFSRANAPTVTWQNRIVIPNGEVRPRVRTPEVWTLTEARIP